MLWRSCTATEFSKILSRLRSVRWFKWTSVSETESISTVRVLKLLKTSLPKWYICTMSELHLYVGVSYGEAAVITSEFYWPHIMCWALKCRRSKWILNLIFRFMWPCIIIVVYEKNQLDVTGIDVYSCNVNSTCFEHHYAHHQENRLYKKLLVVNALLCWLQSCRFGTRAGAPFVRWYTNKHLYLWHLVGFFHILQ